MKRVTQKSKTDLRVTFLFYNDRKVRRVRVMGWGDINKLTVILLKISEITVVFMVKDCYIYSAKKRKTVIYHGSKDSI